MFVSFLKKEQRWLISDSVGFVSESLTTVHRYVPTLELTKTLAQRGNDRLVALSPWAGPRDSTHDPPRNTSPHHERRQLPIGPTRSHWKPESDDVTGLAAGEA